MSAQDEAHPLADQNARERHAVVLLFIAAAGIGGVFLWNAIVIALAFAFGRPNEVGAAISWWWVAPWMILLQVGLSLFKHACRTGSDAPMGAGASEIDSDQRGVTAAAQRPFPLQGVLFDLSAAAAALAVVALVVWVISEIGADL
jgi:hypothetical protein